MGKGGGGECEWVKIIQSSQPNSLGTEEDQTQFIADKQFLTSEETQKVPIVIVS